MSARKLMGIQRMLWNEELPLDHRKRLLAQLCMDESSDSENVIERLLASAAGAESESIYAEKLSELNQKLQQLESGPLRPATFLRFSGKSDAYRRVEVVTDDGTSALVSITDDRLADQLRCGDAVLVEPQGKALVGLDDMRPALGESARLERILDDERLEVSLRNDERLVVRYAARLQDAAAGEELLPGSTVMICPRRLFAFDALPAVDGPTHFRFLDESPVPDVVAARDLGNPPAFIRELTDLVRLEMTDPDRRRRFGLPRCFFQLLCGVSGSGKTYGIQALWNALYEVMADVTGVSVDQIPARVLRLRLPQVLSKWLGESEQNLERFSKECEQLADTPFVDGAGRSHNLPLLVVLEEIDGLARARGEETLHDRILTTALQLLDPARAEIRNRLIIFVATTNVPELVDAAFLRRVGGAVETFGRLDRRGFLAVLDKRLGEIPIAAAGGSAASGQNRNELLAEVVEWAFGRRRAGRGEVEILLAGSTEPLVKYVDDLLTAGLVDRAVTQACSAACQAGESGVTAQGLNGAFLDQVRAVVDALHESNARSYVDLPDGARVASVRRIPARSPEPIQLVRAL